MNRLYIIVPLALLAVFSGVYWQHNQEAAEQAKEKAVAVAQTKAIEEAKKAESDRQSREDTAKRETARLAEEQKKDLEKRSKWETDSVRIAEDTSAYTAKAAEAAKQVETLQKQLADLRASRKTLNEEAFSAAHDTEILSIQKRDAELEIQRMNEILVRKAGGTSRVGVNQGS